MEAILFTGLPGSGKSSFYQGRFFHTHVRISLDLLKTRYREQLFLQACLTTEQRFVVDNTNPSRGERSRYITAIRAARVRYALVGYCFESTVDDCLARNATRSGGQRIPDVGIYSAAKRLEVLSWEEGFDQLYDVQLQNGRFLVVPRTVSLRSNGTPE